MTLADLIAQLESATGGSRELDEKIALVRFPDLKSPPVRDLAAGAERAWYLNGMLARIARYTGSLDDALMLAKPPGFPMWTWRIVGTFDSTPAHDLFTAEITIPSSEFQGFGRTAPLAMCAAALRMLSHPRITAVTTAEQEGTAA